MKECKTCLYFKVDKLAKSAVCHFRPPVHVGTIPGAGGVQILWGRPSVKEDDLCAEHTFLEDADMVTHERNKLLAQ